jgi:hypothetical protein
MSAKQIQPHSEVSGRLSCLTREHGTLYNRRALPDCGRTAVTRLPLPLRLGFAVKIADYPQLPLLLQSSRYGQYCGENARRSKKPSDIRCCCVPSGLPGHKHRGWDLTHRTPGRKIHAATFLASFLLVGGRPRVAGQARLRNRRMIRLTPKERPRTLPPNSSSVGYRTDSGPSLNLECRIS